MPILKFSNILIAFLIKLLLSINQIHPSCRMRNGCTVKPFVEHSGPLIFKSIQSSFIITCDSSAGLNYFGKSCPINTTNSQHIYIIIRDRVLEDSAWSIELFKMVDSPIQSEFTKFSTHFENIRGLNAQRPLKIPSSSSNINFYNSKLEFVNNQAQRVRTCNDFLKLRRENNSDIHFIGSSQPNDVSLSVKFRNIEFGPRAICELAFANVYMDRLEINSLINSYYKRNLLRFEEIDRNSSTNNLNATILTLVIQSFDSDLDRNLLNPRVFAEIKDLRIKKRLRSISVDVFRPFFKLRLIEFDSKEFVRIVHKQGIEWIKSLNAEVNIDLDNLTQIQENWDKMKALLFYDQKGVTLDPRFEFFTNEDFCSMKEFPFEQLVCIDILIEHWKRTKSCTTLWLLKNTRRIYEGFGYLYFLPDLNNSLLQTCEFNKRIEMCDKRRFR